MDGRPETSRWKCEALEAEEEARQLASLKKGVSSLVGSPGLFPLTPPLAKEVEPQLEPWGHAWSASVGKVFGRVVLAVEEDQVATIPRDQVVCQCEKGHRGHRMCGSVSGGGPGSHWLEPRREARACHEAQACLGMELCPRITVSARRRKNMQKEWAVR